MKGMNVIHLAQGKQIRIFVDHEDGFINNIKIEGDLDIQPPDSLKKIERHLSNSHFTSVAIFSRLEFYLLKNKVRLGNINSRSLAEAIADCQNHPINS